MSTIKLPNRTPLAPDDGRAIERFVESLWLERGLSEQTLSAYRSDLELLGGWLSTRGTALLSASRADLLEHLAWRLGAGYQSRSTRA